MAGQINVQPQVVNLALYSGDGISIRLVCKDNVGASLNMTGTFKAQIRLDRSSPDPAIVEFTFDLTNASTGIIVLTLTGVETLALMSDPSTSNDKFIGVWDVQWTPSGSPPRTLCQGKVECIADVTR